MPTRSYLLNKTCGLTPCTLQFRVSGSFVTVIIFSTYINISSCYRVAFSSPSLSAAPPCLSSASAARAGGAFCHRDVVVMLMVVFLTPLTASTPLSLSSIWLSAVEATLSHVY